MSRRLSARDEEDTQPDLRISGKSAFARLFPRLECWAENRRTAGRLLKEADLHERKAGEWERRGHHERSGFCLEMAANAVANAMHVRYGLKEQRRHDGLLRKAVVSYALELKERYDPGLDWRIYKVAMRVNEPALAADHFNAAIRGFEGMIQDPALDSQVRLSRLKRRLLERVCERDAESAMLISYEALDAASRARPGEAEKIAETRAWVCGRFRDEFGGTGGIYLKSVEEYRPSPRR